MTSAEADGIEQLNRKAIQEFSDGSQIITKEWVVQGAEYNRGETKTRSRDVWRSTKLIRG